VEAVEKCLKSTYFRVTQDPHYLTSRIHKKVCADLIRGAKEKQLKVKGPVRQVAHYYPARPLISNYGFEDLDRSRYVFTSASSTWWLLLR
jgi:hypothetical protein